jgi:hypothetical protein
MSSLFFFLATQLGEASFTDAVSSQVITVLEYHARSLPPRYVKES